MSNKQSQESLGFAQGHVDWNEYMKLRPPYPQSFYDRIYAQRAKTGDSFALVNDCGAGSGVASQQLAKKFDKVIVSEPNEIYLDFARQHLKSQFPKEKFEFLAEGGEKSSIKSGTLDALTICEALHWCDIDTALKEFHRQLKPGGVLCICHYSRPYVREPWGHLYDEMWADSFTRTNMGEVYGRAWKNVSAGYQSIAFPEDLWEPGVQRVMINSNGDASVIGSAVCIMHGMEPEPSRVGKNDIETWREDDPEWIQKRDLKWFKEVYYAMLPWEKEEEDGDKWTKIEKAIGDKSQKFKTYFPATQIIATKKIF